MFSLYVLRNHVALFLSFNNVMYHIDWFVDIETALHPRNKSHVVVVILLMYCWNRLAGILLRIFASMFIREIVCSSPFYWGLYLFLESM